MTLIYQSVDALVANQYPSQNCQCDDHHWSMTSELIDQPPLGLAGLRLGWWVCNTCSDETDRYLYIDRRDILWTLEQVATFRRNRRERNMSLKDVSALTRISVSRLSDFERRHAGPTQDEVNALIHIFKGDCLT